MSAINQRQQKTRDNLDENVSGVPNQELLVTLIQDITTQQHEYNFSIVFGI